MKNPLQKTSKGTMMSPLTQPLGILTKSAFSAALMFSITASGLAASTWNGAGVSGGTGGVDFDNTANWSGGVVSGTINLNSSATLTLSSATTTLDSLYLGWGGSQALTLNGNGTGTKVLALNPATSSNLIVLASSGNNTPTTTTLGSDVTLDFGSFSTNRTISTYLSNKGATLLLNGLVTGTATGSANITLQTNASVTLTNDGNTFDSGLTVGSKLSFTSINNVGSGVASSLGMASTSTRGAIAITSGGNLCYIGSTDQSSNRSISIGVGNSKTISHTGAGGTITYSSNIAMQASGSNTQIVTFTAANAGAKIVMSGILSDASTSACNKITTSGSGTISFTNTANTYAGITTVDSGVLEVTKLSNGGVSSSIGTSSSSAANLIIGSTTSGTLRYIGAGDDTDRAFTTGSKGATIDASGAGALRFTNTSATAFTGSGFARTITLTGINTGDNTLAAAITNDSGSGVTSVSKTGSGRWILSGASTYTGTTSVLAGELDVNGSLSASPVSIASGAALGGSGTVNGTVSGTNIAIKGSGLTMGATTLYGASTITGTANASGISIATGTTSLSGRATSSNSINVLTGATLINTGTAAVTSGSVGVAANGVLKNTGAVNGAVFVSGSLSGTGTITGSLTIQSGGELSTGSIPGTTTVNGDLSVATGGMVSLQLNTLTSADKVQVNGAASLGGTLTLTLSNEFLSECSALTSGTILTLMEISNTRENTFSKVSFVTQNETYSGTSFALDGATYLLSYTGGDGNDLVLSVQVVPEPATWAMLVGGLGALVFGQRLSRRRHA